MESYSCLSTSSIRTEWLPHSLAWTQSPLGSLFLSDEDILEAITEPYYPWDAMHHCLFFLPKKHWVLKNRKPRDLCNWIKRFPSIRESWLVQKSHSGALCIRRREHVKHWTHHQGEYLSKSWEIRRNFTGGSMLPTWDNLLHPFIARVLRYIFMGLLRNART